jgi:ethanolamine utilization microcompartment shell protein EutL
MSSKTKVIAVDKVIKQKQTAIVTANNHYAGFGTATANSFRKTVGLMGVVWEEMKQNGL